MKAKAKASLGLAILLVCFVGSAAIIGVADWRILLGLLLWNFGVAVAKPLISPGS